jgi:hypothetical protein
LVFHGGTRKYIFTKIGWESVASLAVSPNHGDVCGMYLYNSKIVILFVSFRAFLDPVLASILDVGHSKSSLDLLSAHPSSVKVQL